MTATRKPTKPQAEVLALIEAGQIEYTQATGAFNARYRSVDPRGPEWSSNNSVVATVVAKGWVRSRTLAEAMGGPMSKTLTLTPAGVQALASTRKDTP